MSVEAALVGYLALQPAVVTLVGSRIEPVQNAQGTALPAVAYQMIGRPYDYSQSGAALAYSRIQFTISAATFADVVAVADALRSALAGRKLPASDGGYPMFVDNEMDGIAPAAGQAGYYLRRIDVVIQH